MSERYSFMKRVGRVVTGILIGIILPGWLTTLFAQEAVGNSMTFVVPFPGSTRTNDMTVYICAGARAANVTVTAFIDKNETSAVYHIPANSGVEIPAVSRGLMMLSDPAQREIVLRRSVRIHSDVPITAYAHYYKDHASGSSTLTPVRKWGYYYRILDSPHDWWPFATITAAYDSTVVEIVPTQTTSEDKPAGRPYIIKLNKNETYQLNVPTAASGPREITGTTIRSLPNSFGINYPVCVFVGSTGLIVKSNPLTTGSADFEAEQAQPVCRWGRRYLTVPFASPVSSDPNASEWTYFRIMPEDPKTVVRKNGIVLNGLINNSYYEFINNTGDYIEADGPIMMMQCMFTQDEDVYKQYQGGDGDVLHLTALDDTCRVANFRLPDKANIRYTFVSVAIPTAGLSSLTINGGKNFHTTYPHPNRPGYTVVVKKWMPPVAGDCIIRCDYPFTGLCYSGGLPPTPPDGTAESCSFDISPVSYPEGDAMVSGKDEKGLMKNNPCVGDSFKLVLKTDIRPVKMEWSLKGYPGVMPNDQNVVVNNPVPDSTVTRDGHKYYYFTMPQYYKLTAPGDYAIPVTITSPEISYCSQTQTYITALRVLKGPVADFSYTSAGCVPFDVKFTAGAAGDTSVLTAWNWDFGATQATTAVTNHTYNTAGDKPVYLRVTARNGCMADTLRTLRLAEAAKPVAAFQLPAIVCLPDKKGEFINQTTYAGTAPGGLTWQWDFGDNGKSVEKDPAHLFTQKRSYDVQLIATASDGCADTTSQKLTDVFNSPKAVLDQSETELCVGENLILTDLSIPGQGSTIAKWDWLFGDDSHSTLQNPEKKYNRPASPFTIRHYVVSNEGCFSDTITATVNVFDVPRVEAGPDKVVLEDATVQLQGTVTVSGIATVKWSPATWLSADNVPAPYVINAKSDQLYYLTVTSGKCSAYDSVQLKVLPNLIVPNAFTPNGDGNHDVWDIPGLNTYPAATVQVFNRYGQKVFESKGYNVRWNGTYQGKDLPSATYYYIIRPGAGKPVQTGPVTIIR